MVDIIQYFHPFNVSFLSLIFFIYFLLKHLITSQTNPKKASLPSPPKLPIIGNLHQLGLFPHRALSSLSRRYGPLMLLHFGSKPVLVVSSAEAAREILRTHDLNFATRPKTSITDKLLYNSRDVVAAPYGEYWRQMKSICVLHLLSNKSVQSFRGVREEEVAILIKNVAKVSGGLEPMNLGEMFLSLTNNVITRVACGRKYSEEDEEGRKFKELLGELMTLLGGFSVGDFVPWLKWISWVNGFDGRVEKTAKGLDIILDGIVEEHVVDLERKIESDSNEEEGPTDFVDVLLRLQREDVNNSPIDRENIKALILDMFAAGTDSTYTVLEWAMAELLRNPRVMEELQKEVRGIDHDFITEADLENLQYLKWVIKETIRSHPPIPMLSPREAIKDVKVMGYDIKAGTMVTINAWPLARDPVAWARPEEFWPERFLIASADFKGQDFEFLPFGSGRRKCPGIGFATSVVELALANLVKKFEWALPGGAKGEDMDMTESPGATIHRKEPLVAVASIPSSS